MSKAIMITVRAAVVLLFTLSHSEQAFADDTFPAWHFWATRHDICVVEGTLGDRKKELDLSKFDASGGANDVGPILYEVRQIALERIVVPSTWMGKSFLSQPKKNVKVISNLYVAGNEKVSEFTSGKGLFVLRQNGIPPLPQFVLVASIPEHELGAFNKARRSWIEKHLRMMKANTSK